MCTSSWALLDWTLKFRVDSIIYSSVFLDRRSSIRFDFERDKWIDLKTVSLLSCCVVSISFLLSIDSPRVWTIIEIRQKTTGRWNLLHWFTYLLACHWGHSWSNCTALKKLFSYKSRTYFESMYKYSWDELKVERTGHLPSDSNSSWLSAGRAAWRAAWKSNRSIGSKSRRQQPLLPSSGRCVQKPVPFLHRIINRNVMMTTERKRSITTSFVFLPPYMMHLEGGGRNCLLSFSLVVSSICDAMPKEAQLHLLVSKFDSGCASSSSSSSTSSFPSTAPNPNLINFSRRREKNLR